MTFGERIRQLRLERRFSQRELASEVGIDFTYLSKIENNRVAPPSDRVIHSLAVALDADVEELLSLAVKVSQKDLRKTVARDRRLGVLFRRLQSGKLSESQIRQVLKIVESCKENGTPSSH